MGDFEFKKRSRLPSVLGKFGYIKWENIAIQYMVQFYGILLHMRIDPCHLEVYEGYFKPILYVRFGRVYNKNLFKYEGWAERIMTPARFHRIILVFHPYDQ